MADNVLETGHFECILANKNYKEEKTLMLKKRQLTTIALALTFIMLFASVAGAVTVPTNVYYTNAEDQVVKANYEAAGDAYDAGNTAMWNALKSGIISAMRAGKAVVVETATKTVNYLDAALAGKTLEEATTDTAYDTTNPTVDKELDTSGNVVDPGTTAVTVTAITDKEVQVGATLEVPVTTDPADATIAALSSDEAVATATVAGSTITLTGVAAGTATITVGAAKDGYTSGTTTFVVTVPDFVAPVVTTVAITTAAGGTVTVGGDTLTLAAEVKDQNGAVMTDQTITWTSSDTTKATIADGVVTAVAAGTTNITAAVGTVSSDAYAVTVNAAPAPAVVSVTATNATTLTVVYNIAVDTTTAETATNYEVTKVVNAGTYTSKNPLSAVLSTTDYKTVTLTMGSSEAFVTSTNGYSLKVLNNILAKGSTTNKITTTEVMFDGVGTADDAAPSINSVTYDSGNKQVTLQFSKPISLLTSDVDKTKITLVGSGTSQSLAMTNATFTASSTPAANLVLTLSTTDNTTLSGYTTPLTCTLDASAVKDSSNVGNAAATGIAVTKLEKPVIQSAVYSQGTNTLTLTFNTAVASVNATKLTVSLTGGATATLTLDSRDIVSIASNGLTVSIVLNNVTASGESTNNVSAIENSSVTARVINAAANAFTAVNTSANTAHTATATYTTDTVVPTLNSASYNDLTDVLTLTFNEDIDTTNVNKTNVRIFDGSTTYSGTTYISVQSTAVAAAVNSNPKQIAITLSSASDRDLLEASTITRANLKVFFASGTFKDVAGNSIAALTSTTAAALTYVDQTAPALVLTAATNGELDSSASTSYTATDATHVKLVFNGAMDTTTTSVLSNYTVALSTNPTVTFAPSAAYTSSDGTTVYLTIADTSTYANSILKVSVTGVKDSSGNAINTASGSTTYYGYIKAVSTASSVTGPKPTATAFTDVGTGNVGSISTGDKLEITFDKAIQLTSSLAEADFALTGLTGATFGSGATYAIKTGSNTVLVVTLGSSPKLAASSTTNPNGVVTVNIKTGGSANIKDLLGNSSIVGTPTAITFSDAAPILSSAYYYDTKNDAVVGEDDTIVLTFDKALAYGGTNTGTSFAATSNTTANVTTATTNTAITAGQFVTDGASFGIKSATISTSDPTKITLTLNAATATITLGAHKIYANASTISTVNTLTSAWGTLANNTTAKVINKADSATATITAAEFLNNDASTGAAVTKGDQIVLTFSKPVTAGTLADDDMFIYNGGVNTDLKFGSGAAGWVKSQPYSDKTKVVLTNVAGTYYITASSTSINVKLGGITTIADSYGNGVAQASSPVTLTASSSTVIAGTATALTNGTAAGNFKVDAANNLITMTKLDTNDNSLLGGYIILKNDVVIGGVALGNNADVTLTPSTALAAGDAVKVMLVKKDGTHTALPTAVTVAAALTTADLTALKLVAGANATDYAVNAATGLSQDGTLHVIMVGGTPDDVSVGTVASGTVTVTANAIAAAKYAIGDTPKYYVVDATGNTNALSAADGQIIALVKVTGASVATGASGTLTLTWGTDASTPVSHQIPVALAKADFTVAGTTFDNSGSTLMPIVADTTGATTHTSAITIAGTDAYTAGTTTFVAASVTAAAKVVDTAGGNAAAVGAVVTSAAS